MAQDWRVHAVVYFCSAVDDLLGAVFHWHLDLEFIDMTIQLATEDGDFYGLPRDSVSSSNAGGNGVTAGETAPCRAVKQKSERLACQ
jgi:hypothetical protein